jgi:hypothetical protein
LRRLPRRCAAAATFAFPLTDAAHPNKPLAITAAEVIDRNVAARGDEFAIDDPLLDYKTKGVTADLDGIEMLDGHKPATSW